MAQHCPSDATIYENMRAFLTAAWRAKVNVDYVLAMSMTKAARNDARMLSRRFLDANNIADAGDTHSFRSSVLCDRNMIRLKYISCVDNLFHAIQSHALGHAAQMLAAQAAAQHDKDATDVRILEAIAHFETYHVHIKEYDAQTMQLARLQLQPFMPSICDQREDALAAHMQRISYISWYMDRTDGVQHRHDTVLCEYLHFVSDVFSPLQLAHFRAEPNLRQLHHGKAREILQALVGCMQARANELYVATKKSLCLRDFTECKRTAILGLHLFDVCMYGNITQMKQHSAAVNSHYIYRIKAMFSLCRALELANDSVLLAHTAADRGRPITAEKHIVDATKHWDNHDRLVIALNSLLLENYDHDVQDISDNASVSDTNRAMQQAENWHGKLPNTAYERRAIQTTFEDARYNMLSRGTMEVRNALRLKMHDGIFHATEGIQRMAVE